MSLAAIKRDSSKPASYYKILDAAKELFFQFGIEKVQVSDIYEKAGVSKMTLYRSFENKYEIAFILMKNHCDEGMAQFHRIMDEEHVSFKDKMQEILLFKKQNNLNLSNQLLNDIYSGNENTQKIQDLFHELSDTILHEYKEYLISAQRNGEIKQELNVDFVIYTIAGIGKLVEDPSMRKLLGTANDVSDQFFTLIFHGILSE